MTCLEAAYLKGRKEEREHIIGFLREIKRWPVWLGYNDILVDDIDKSAFKEAAELIERAAREDPLGPKDYEYIPDPMFGY